MGKLTKKELQLHDQAVALIDSGRELSRDEVAFVLENWAPTAEHNVVRNAVFFTPLGLASDLAACSLRQGRIVDLCAGIGHLAHAILAHEYWRTDDLEIVAVEWNQEFVRVGQRILPQVQWVQGDVFDLNLWRKLGRFDYAVANPPYGNIKSSADQSWLTYRGPADLMIAEIALRISENGATMILPSGSVPYEFSGKQTYSLVETPMTNLRRFLKTFPGSNGYPGVDFGCSSIDASIYAAEWRGTKPSVELVPLEWGEHPPLGLPESPEPNTVPTQIALAL